ncbi:hypothetical protein M8J75_007519 [Diaphorina citri]|nr:hypothetical protein M8J75_007519 [Diaphorina citri]
MGKRGHGGKKRSKKQRGEKNKENVPTKNAPKLNGKVILDNSYQGKLRAVTIQDIDDDFDLKEIAENLTSIDGKAYSLYSIERLNSKKTSDKGDVQIVPSKTCKLTFKGDLIPSKLKIWHLSTTCKGYPRCSKCGGRKEDDHKCSLQTLKCANCKGEHDAMNKECPVYVFNKECNEIMANSNVDYKTAVNLHAKKIKFAQTVLSKIDTTENIVEALMKQFDTNKIFVKTLVKKVLSDIK